MNSPGVDLREQLSRRVQLRGLIIDRLSRRPGVSGRDLRTGLAAELPGIAKGDINGVLYSDPSTFWNDGGQPPRWHLIVSSQDPRKPNKAERAALIEQLLREVDPFRQDNISGRPGQDNFPDLYKWQAEALDAWRARGRRAVVEAGSASPLDADGEFRDCACRQGPRSG